MASRKQTPSVQSAEHVPGADMTDLDVANAAAAEAGTNAASEFQPSEFNHVTDAAASVGAAPEFAVTALSMLEGALFPARPSSDCNENAPEMTGMIRLDDSAQRVPIAGFVKTAKETGQLYLALSVGFKDGPRYYGRLFAASHQSHANAPDYSGFIVLLPVVQKDQYTKEQWEEAPTLRVRGYRRRNAADNRARIQLLGAPVGVADHELPI